jgi:hypothetical protein
MIQANLIFRAKPLTPIRDGRRPVTRKRLVTRKRDGVGECAAPPRIVSGGRVARERVSDGGHVYRRGGVKLRHFVAAAWCPFGCPGSPWESATCGAACPHKPPMWRRARERLEDPPYRFRAGLALRRSSCYICRRQRGSSGESRLKGSCRKSRLYCRRLLLSLAKQIGGFMGGLGSFSPGVPSNWRAE